MRLRVNPPHFRDDLLALLRGSACLAVKHGTDGIDTHLLNSVSERHDRAVLAGCIEAWKARHAGADVEILQG
jgi:hypothetical protein